MLIGNDVSKHVLDGPRWRRTGWGYYVPSSVPLTPTQRIVEAATMAPPGAVIAGWAAAYALGTDQLDGRDDHTMQDSPVSVLLPPSLHRQSVVGVRYREDRVSKGETVAVGGLLVTDGLRTALDLARWASSTTEAVVMIDAVLAARVVSRSVLVHRAGELTGVRGIRQCRTAVAHCRIGVRSPWESRLRMLCELDLRWPALRVNQPLFDGAGRLLGIPDLLDAEAGLAIEYDGVYWSDSEFSGGHRHRTQHRADNAREELFERSGLIVVRAVKDDLTRHRDELERRLTAARTEGLSRDRRRDRWCLVQTAA